MPSTNGSAPPSSDIAPASSDVASAARRYHRAERAVSWLVAFVAVAVVLAAIDTLPLLPAAVVAVGIVTLARVPLVSRSGHTRLITDAEPAAVVAAFRSVTPPILAFQWAIADEVDPGSGDGDSDDGRDSAGGSPTRATYELSYLFGLRSVSMTLDVRSAEPANGGGAAAVGTRSATDASDVVDTLEVSATAGGRPWGTYRVTIRAADPGTVVDVEMTTDRRFDLRSVPQALVAERYVEAVFSAQGYRVADRSVSWSV
jgi:hypothetical protein